MLRRFSFSLAAVAVAMTGLVLSSRAPAAIGPQGPAQVGAQGDCVQVCGEVNAKLKRNKKLVDEEYKQWQERLGVKGDVIRFDQGLSAAEELLRFMSTYYRRQAPGQQMEPTFLAYMMSKCFPETYIDASRARMSGLVDTIWAAENLHIEQQINTCK
jgi:hypothetical protein